MTEVPPDLSDQYGFWSAVSVLMASSGATAESCADAIRACASYMDLTAAQVADFVIWGGRLPV